MIYKFIDDHGAEITVNSLSQLQALVEDKTIKKSTKLKVGLRGKWGKAKDVKELKFEEEKKEEKSKKLKDIESYITNEPIDPPKKEKISKIKKQKVDLESKRELPKEEVVKTEDIIQPPVELPSEDIKVEYTEVKNDESEKFYDDDEMEDINVIESIKICFRKFLVIQGRASRSEYWWFVLATIIFDILCELIDYSLGYSYYDFGPFFFISLITLIPATTAGIRRLHDQNKSGWWLLISFTIIGLIPLLIWLVSKGTRGKNRFGEYPLRFKGEKKQDDEFLVDEKKKKDNKKSLVKNSNIFKYLFILAILGLIAQFFIMGEHDLFVKTKIPIEIEEVEQIEEVEEKKDYIGKKEEKKDYIEKKEEKKNYIVKVNNLPKELFGLKILDNPKKYLYKEAEGQERDYGGILKHTWYRAEDIKNLVTNAFFDRYDIAVVDNSITAIQANRNISGYLTQEKFKEICVDEREDFFARFLKENKINRNLFERKYFKGKTKTNRIFFIDRISTDYNYKNSNLRLYFSCNYGFIFDEIEKINTVFVFRLSTTESSAAGEKYSNYKSTRKFNEVYLKSFSLEQ